MPFISSLRWVYSDSNIEEIENIHSSLLSRTRTVTHSSKHEDTIFSLATGQGRAGVAVIRISGTATFKAVEKLCQITSSALNQVSYLFLFVFDLFWLANFLDLNK